MRSLNALTWRNLTAHPLRSILTLLAISLGVAMVLAASVIGQAAGQSTAELAKEGPRLDLEIFSRDGVPFNDDVLDVLHASPDVELTSPSLRVEVEGIAPPIIELTLLGIDPEIYATLHELELAGGTFLDGPDTIVLPMAVAINHRLSVGDEVTVTAGGRRVTLTVAGRLSVGQDGILPHSGQPSTAFVPLHTAQALADASGQVDRVEVALHPGTDVTQAKTDLAQAVGPDLAVVRAVATEGTMGNVVLMQASLAIVGLIILFAASFVILNAFAMSVTGRTREIGALRALGMTRRQVLRTVMAEAGVLGLAGTAAGVLVGLGLAWIVMRTFGNLEDAPFTVPWWGLSLSALLGLAVTLVAALQPAWRAGRVSPIVAVRPETTAATGWYVRSGGRVGAVLLALLLPGLTVFGLLARPNIAVALPVMVLGQTVLLGAMVLLLPALIAPVTALCRPLLARWLGTAGRLAADNLGRNKLRAVLTAGALTAGLTIIVATSGLMTAGLKGAVSSMRSAAGNEDVFITGDLAEIVASQELTFDNFFEFLTQDDLGFDLNQAVDALNPLVEAGQIEVIRYRFQVVPPDLATVPGAPGLFVDPEVYLRIGNFDFFEGDSQTALARMQRGRAMLLTPIVAERLGAELGDQVPVQTPHGEVTFTVAGIGGGGFLMTVFPYADGETYFDVGKPSFLGVAVAEGGNVEATLAQVEAAIEPFPEITLLDYDESLDPVLEIVDRLSLLLDGLLLLAVVVAALGVVNTMVINVAERGREIGLLRAVGATQRQVRQAVVAEAATLGLLAALVASGLGLLMLLTWGVLILPNGAASVGVRADWETVRLTLGAGLRDAGLASLVALIFGPLVAALAAYYPARQAAAMDVVEATRSEQVTLKRVSPERRRAEHSKQHRRAARSFTWTMAWRNLAGGRTRAILSVLAVTLGVAMTIAGSVIGDSVVSAISNSEVARFTGVELFEQLALLLTLIGVAVTAAAGFLVFNAFAMSVTQRRQQIGALRSLGMTRRQVLRLMLIEALITSGLGTSLGLVAGPLMGRGIIALLKSTDTFLNAFTESSTSLPSFLLAAALGVGITVLSVLLPAWRAMRVSPLDALRAPKPASIVRNPTGPARVGLAIVAGVVVYLLVAPPGEWVMPPQDNLLTGLFAVAWLAGLALMLPALVGGLGDRVRQPLTRWLGAVGRLIADNLQRGRGRVTLTIATLAVGLTMIVGMSGFITFFLNELFGKTLESAVQQRGWVISSFKITDDVAAFAELDSPQLAPEAVEKVEAVVNDRADVLAFYFALVPDLSFLGPNYFSFILDPDALRETGTTFFTFTEGDWETAMPIMESGCGLLLTPLVAQKRQVQVGDTLNVPGVAGDVECTVAGIGRSYVSASIISSTAREAFGVTDLLSLYVSPSDGANPAQLEADLYALADRHSDIHVMPLDDMAGLQKVAFDQVRATLNGLLLLAILAAALGVVNTTVMSVAERQRELSLLRAVGAIRRQVSAVIVGEASLMGLIGGGLGLVAGAGITVILVMVYGGNAFGLDLDLWATAWRVVQPALLNGLIGLVAAPFICAGAAWLPTRSILRGSAIETMEAERQVRRTSEVRRTSMRSINFLAWRNLEQGRTRTILSALAVALGAAMIVASSVVKAGVRDTWASGESSMAWVADMIDIIFTSVGVIILAAAGFLIFNAFAMAVTQQRRQIGALRSLGMTRRQVMRQVLIEALVTGGLGTLLGLVAGPMFGRGILAWMKQMDLDVGRGSVSPASVLLAVVMALGITLLSVLVPARRATRVSPLTAIREHEPTARQTGEAASRRTRARVGLVMLGVMIVYLIIAPPGEWSGGAPPWEWIMWLFLWSVWLVGWLLVLPALVTGLTRLLRAPLNRFGGTIGRLIADNLEREPRRVALTVLTFAVGLTMIVGVGGLLAFSNGVLVMRTAEHGLQQTAWFVYSFDRTQGMAQISSFDTETMGLEPAIVQEIRQVAAGRADVDEVYMVSVPEISAIMPGFPSSVATLHYMTRPDGFRFIEGDWETALPMMESGCGLLVPPGVTARHKVGIGDTLIVQGRDGPVECRVAGIGVGGMIPFSIIGIAAKDEFLPPDQPPDSLGIHPLPGVDIQALEADLYALSDRHGDKVWISKPEEEVGAVTDTSDQLQGMLNGMLLLAEIAAALGMINTTVMSITERRRELGLLRAVGATRRQVTAVILSEAALMGLVGAGLGVVAGVGLGAIFALAYGGISFGLVDLPLWEAAGETVLPALRTGWLGFVVAPLLAAAAAYPAIRAILRGSTIETMEPERQQAISPRRAVAGFLGRGSVRTRFVLGTAALMVVVLAGLIEVVTMHARVRIEEQMHDALRTLVTWNAGMIELNLPKHTETLDLSTLQMGQAFDFDSDMLLQFESLVDGMTANGLVDFTIADRDDVVLISLDVREIGTLAPELETSAEVHVYSEREGNEWLMYATAPIRAGNDLVVGSVRLTVDARELQGFLSDLRNTLAAAGSAIILVVLAISWGLSAPLASLFGRLKQRDLRSRFSLRTQLTVAMVFILILMVGALELVAVPIERHHIEDTLKDGLVAAAEWIGQAASESFDFELSDLSPGQTLPFEEMIEMTETLDLARLQELTDQIKSDDAAYVALVDDAGTIVLSDQFALIGEEVSVPPNTQVEEATWRDEEIWVTTTPLRRGRGGEQIGALRMGVRRAGVEVFLDESRNLFRLTGLIAVLAGVLLAQTIGGAVAAPARQVAVGARRIEKGDLLVQLDAGAQDELVILANAYNQMVLGLQEREWLRDMFGRFVSYEVAEAIRSGQVRLEGENRVVSILFCDIRGFTARSEQSTPEGMVALLNEYLPVVVGAAQRHEGTVNKFGGDSTLVVYGAPRHLQESAYQAVLTALEIRADLQALNAKLIERGKDPIRIGVGINTGVALAGAVGPEERQEYAVIGDTVNLASRIEALNKQYPDHDILISGWTYEALGSRRREFEFTDLGEIQIQGKVESVRVWAVVGGHYEP